MFQLQLASTRSAFEVPGHGSTEKFLEESATEQLSFPKQAWNETNSQVRWVLVHVYKV